MAELLNVALQLEIDKSNQKFGRWCEDKMAWIESNQINLQRDLEEYNHTEEALRNQDKQLEASRATNNAIKQRQQLEIEQILTFNDAMKQKYFKLQKELVECEEEEAKESIRLEIAKNDHDILRAKMEQSLNDLAHGVNHYLKLGLEFQRADGDAMKFVFTQIDPLDFNRQFYILILVDNDNLYQLIETNPLLDTKVTTEALQTLNNTNNLRVFMITMRKLFSSLVTNGKLQSK
eukprot:gene14372-19275_t